MSTKEKAIELYGKFRNENSAMSSNIRAKKQAYICVDEILKALKITIGHCELRVVDAMEVVKDLGYWQDVKKEIEKL